MTKKRVPKKRKVHQPVLGKHYKKVVDLLRSDDSHAWFGPLVALLGLTVGALALVAENAYSDTNDEKRLTALAGLLSSVAMDNSQTRREAGW